MVFGVYRRRRELVVQFEDQDGLANDKQEAEILGELNHCAMGFLSTTLSPYDRRGFLIGSGHCLPLLEWMQGSLKFTPLVNRCRFWCGLENRMMTAISRGTTVRKLLLLTWSSCSEAHITELISVSSRSCACLILSSNQYA